MTAEPEGRPEGCDPRLLIDGDFILVRTAIVDALDGDYAAAIVFQRIHWRAQPEGYWVASRQQVQDETRLSRWKVDQALRTLRDKGWLVGEAEGGYDRTMRWTPRYSGDASPGNQAINSLETRRSTSLTDRETNTSSPYVGTSPGRGEDEQAFERFWTTYPRCERVRVTRAAWDAALRKASAEEIISAAARYAALCEGRGGEFVSPAVTWLNDERWRDRLPEPPVRFVTREERMHSEPPVDRRPLPMDRRER